MRPNAPKMATVLLALGLLAVGLALTVFEMGGVRDQVADLLRENEVDLTPEEAGWVALLGSNVALVVGSLLRGW